MAETLASPQVVALIPARHQSSRFPGKPLAAILGRPMIEHVYRRACQVASLSRVVVATDDERIAACVRGFGGEVVLTRESHPTGTDRLAEAAGLLRLSDQDIVVNIQGDQPLFPPAVIDELTRPMLAEPDLPMATLIYRIRRPEEIRDPNHVKTVFDRQGNALYFSRATIPFDRDGGRPGPFYKHLGFYAYRKGFLTIFVGLPEGDWERRERLEQLRALEHGFRIRVVETGHDSIEVDTPADVARVEECLRQAAAGPPARC
ncbi:MAG: 3-deoxy-manno-octulosonate cytidylyltransferase [Thermodesulfobacteriota bacterium]